MIDKNEQVFYDENLKYLEEASRRVKDKIVQDWRRSNRHSAIYDDRPSSPDPPSTSADIWSFGCLITEALTGRKLFQTGDKLASVLRPSQLLEMKLAETETAWAEKGHQQIFSLIKDLIQRCIKGDPKSRISAVEALNHPVFLHKPGPSMKDLFLLPSPLLEFSQFTNKDSKETNEIREEMLKDLRVECEAYGEITECNVAEGGHAYVHFKEVQNHLANKNVIFCLYIKFLDIFKNLSTILGGLADFMTRTENQFSSHHHPDHHQHNQYGRLEDHRDHDSFITKICNKIKL